jgi:prephenate dehydrogenase
MTRLALSSPELWEPILTTNRDFVLAAMDAFSEEFRIVRSAVASGDLSEVFESGRIFASQLRLRNEQKQF